MPLLFASPKDRFSRIVILVFCASVDCGPLAPPDNGAVDTPSGTTLGKEAHYRCNSGHDLSGSSVVVCLSTGKWSDVPPRCLIKGIVIIRKNFWYI